MSYKLHILSANINGSVSKLEQKHCLDLLCKYDVVILQEVKTNHLLNLPGFRCVRSSVIEGEEKRGGVMVLFKHMLYDNLVSVNRFKDQVWFTLRFMPEFLFGACYVTPLDSPYFDRQSLAVIQENCMSNKYVVILGDLNARLADLSRFQNQKLGISYSENPDQTTNSHGREILSICNDFNLVPVNHMCIGGIQCEGGFTYRQKQNWISQIDWCICSQMCVQNIDSFCILNQVEFPSNHAPISVLLSHDQVAPEIILERAKLLNEIPQAKGSKHTCKPYRMWQLNMQKFQESLPDPETLVPTCDDEAVMLCETITNTLYQACELAVERQRSVNLKDPRNANERWKNLLSIGDPRKVWQAIDWKGRFNKAESRNDTPSDDEFAEHFRQLLNPLDVQDLVCPETVTYVPVLDDPISEAEVFDEISSMSPDKAPGTDGIPAGILKHISDQWIWLITFLLNMVFIGVYPGAWCIAKFFTIFKKGLSCIPGNYRGISILNTLCKLYDGVLNRRFVLWFKPGVEQAGSQEGRGCSEQILTLRLIIDFARKTKKKLYVVFVDYEKAYDRVNRNTLLNMLAQSGCGRVFLSAVARSITVTRNVLGDCYFDATAGVRQGGSTSCSLFTFYINVTIQKIAEFGIDGFLGTLHCLLLMDDTVILASSRDAMNRKLLLLMEATKQTDMSVHPTKSKYFAINTADHDPFVLGDVVISYQDVYTYLGSPISNSSMVKQVADHAATKQCHVRKFASFIARNSDAPFEIKRKVWESCLNSALLYSCESWMVKNLNPVQTQYLSSVKELLGVRMQTPSSLIYIELDIPSVQALVKKRQVDFLSKVKQSSHFHGSPLQYAMQLAKESKCPMGVYLQELESITSDPVTEFSVLNKDSVQNSEASRSVIYRDLNPDLSEHSMYSDTKVNERYRIVTTRLRLGSHRLKIETGRWSRIPRDMRLCSCDQDVQSEEHVLTQCPLTVHIRRNFPNLPVTNIASLMKYEDASILCNYCNQVNMYFADQ